MLVGFDIGLDELGSNKFDRMSQLLSLLAQKWAYAHASMPIRYGGKLVKKEAICERLSCLLNNCLPCLSTP